MKKAELILANFDARIPKIEIKPQNTASKVIISSKMYDENDKKIPVKITFDDKVTSVPSSTITVNNLKTVINLKQTDKTCNSDGAPSEPV